MNEWMDGWMLGVKTRHAKVAIIQNYHTYSVLNETFIIVVVLSSTRRRATLCEVDVISFSRCRARDALNWKKCFQNLKKAFIFNRWVRFLKRGNHRSGFRYIE
jgi:hypothetical protein